jgi:TolA-binding protein
LGCRLVEPRDHGELKAAAGMPRVVRMFPLYDRSMRITLREEARMTRHNRLGTLAVASLFTLSLGIGSAFAAGEPDPRPSSPSPQNSSPPKGKQGSTKKKQQKSEQEFRNQYRAAYALVQDGKYAEAFAAFKAMDEDDHPDVANYLGYTARKLGDYQLSKVWYERALESDPKHVRTWQYYGMWQVEQGNKLKAADFLEQIRLICGTQCKEYQDLKGGMEGTVTY